MTGQKCVGSSFTNHSCENTRDMEPEIIKIENMGRIFLSEERNDAFG